MISNTHLRFASAGLVLLAACGGRTGLSVGTGGHASASSVTSSASASSSVAASSSSSASSASSSSSGACTFPALPPPTPPPPLGSACTFSQDAVGAPVFATVVGGELIAVTPQGTPTTLFKFSAADGMASIESRGQYLGALMTVGGATSLSVEFVLVQLDGTVIAHHLESFDTMAGFGGQAVAGNTAGTFAFGAWLGEVGRVWVASADGRILGPFDGLQPGFQGMETDDRGRVLVLPIDANDTQDLFWLDPCSGGMTQAMLPAESISVAAWGSALFGLTAADQPSRETADGITALALPTDPKATLWDFVAPGRAMLYVPPFPIQPQSITANLAIVDAVNLNQRAVSLSYPSLSLVPAGAFPGSEGASSNPAGFGLDSAGNVTMFLADATGAIHFHVTADGSTWQPLGPSFATPMFLGELAFAESGGTYVLHGSPNGTTEAYVVVRPTSSVAVDLTGSAAHVATGGGCVADVGAALEIVNATTGARTAVPLPSTVTAVDAEYWAATWIPGDDAVLWSP